MANAQPVWDGTGVPPNLTPAVPDPTDPENPPEADPASGTPVGPTDDAPPADEPVLEVIDLDAMTIAQLRDLAIEQGVDLTGLTIKADIIAAIVDHVPTAEAQPTETTEE